MRLFDRSKPFALFLMLVGIGCGTAFSAAAYVDPTTTTFLAQAIASIAAILGSALVILWRRIRKKVFRFFGVDPNKNKPAEPDFAVLTPEEVLSYDREVKAAREKADLSAKKRYEKSHNLFLPYWKRLIFTFVSLFFLALTVLFLAPAEIYLGNFNDFFFPLSMLSKVMLPIAFVLSALLSLIFAAIPKKVWYFFPALFFGIGVCCYLQALFCNGAMGTLTGGGDVYAASTVVWNLLLWILLLGGAMTATVFVILKKKPRVFQTVLCSVAGLLVFVQAVGIVIQAVKTSDQRSAITYGVVSDKGENTLAKQNNVVVFIVDTATANMVTNTLEEKPDLFSELDGFTYYTDASSRYSRTYPSVPYLLSGEDCDFSLPVGTFLENTYAKSTYLSEMKNAGCNVGVYTENMLLSKSLLANLDNVGENEGISLEGIVTFFCRMVQVSLYRDLPYAAKAPLYYDSEQINGDVVSAHNHYDFEDSFHKKIVSEGVTLLEDASSAFRFYHFNGPHPGSTLRADGYLGLTVTDDIRDVVIGDFCIINSYVKALKDAGVYDETTVIITADHGPSSLGKSLGVEKEAGILMLVKLQNAHGECVTSTAPVCQDDLFATVYRGLGVNSSAFSDRRAIEDIAEGESRSRRYYYSALYSDADGEIARLEFDIQGPATDASSYHYSGNYVDIVYSTRTVSKTRFREDLMK